MSRFATEGERLFSAYLRQRRLAYEYEPAVGPRHPDFVVDHPGLGRVVWEVYEPVHRLQNRADTVDPYPPIRWAFESRKRKQAKASRAAGLPHVVVLGQGHSDTAFDPLMVAGGMFGNVGVTFSVQADAGDPVPPDDVRSTFLGGGRLQSKLNRSVSALALLTSFNPTLWRAETACESRLARVRASSANRSSPRDRAEAVRLIMETYEHLVATGAFDPNACVARITVLHNPHAAIPLDLSAAAGPHDEQWGAVVGDNVVVYTRVTSGIRAWEIPGRRDHAA